MPPAAPHMLRVGSSTYKSACAILEVMQCCARRVLPLDQMGVWVGMARHEGKERSGRVDVCLYVLMDMMEIVLDLRCDGCDGNEVCDGR
jgi:hypothetical protein